MHERSAYLLGSGGWYASHERQTCSALLRNGSKATLIDAGSGIAHLGGNPHLMAGVNEIDIVLTHFHLDHVIGVSAISDQSLPGSPVIHGPGRLLFETPTIDLLHRITAPPILNAPQETLWSEVREISGNTVQAAVGTLGLRRQDRHSCPTLAFRWDDLLTYCTDTAFDSENIEFAKGSKVLAHEAWWDATDPRNVDTHSSGAEAGMIANEAGCESLVLIHLHPGVLDHEAVLREAKLHFEPSELGTDNQRIV